MNKFLGILSIVLIISGSLIVWEKHQRKKEEETLQGLLEFSFLENESDIVEIEVSFISDVLPSIILYFAQTENGWVLPDFMSLPASEKLAELMSDLRSMKTYRYVSTQDSVADRQEIGKQLIRFKMKDGTVHSLAIGNEDDKGGVFVRDLENKRIFLVALDTKWEKDPIDWMDKKLFSFIDEKTVTEFTLWSDGQEYVYRRDGIGFVPDGNHEKEINVAKLVVAIRELAKLEFFRPYPKEMWKESLEENPSYHFSLKMEDSRTLDFQIFKMKKDTVNESYVIQVQDSVSTSRLSVWMRDGVFVYNSFLEKFLLQ